MYSISDNILGEGSFGTVYEGTFEEDEGVVQDVAIKVETRDDDDTKPRQLEYEFRTYLYLLKRGVTCVPKVFCFEEKDDSHVLVMEKFGESLQDFKNPITETQACSIGVLAVRALHQVWKAGVVHRDIKPANLCFTVNGKGIALIDFGLSKRYLNDDGEHIPHRTGKQLTGTPRYSSLMVMGGHEQARRDDAESLVYLLLFLLKRRLPWQGFKEEDREKKHALIFEKKKGVLLKDLFDKMDPHWASLLEYVRNLAFTDSPDLVERYFRKIMASIERRLKR